MRANTDWLFDMQVETDLPCYWQKTNAEKPFCFGYLIKSGYWASVEYRSDFILDTFG